MDATTSATIDSVKGLELVLQAIRTNQKHACALTFDPSSGLKLRFLDSGRVMQSAIALGVSAFSRFQAPGPLTFFVPLHTLLESVATVASYTPQQLHFQYPGPSNSLLITGSEVSTTATTICSYASIATLAAQQDMSSLDDMWDPSDSCSQAILPGLLLREAVEDLEWTGGEVEFVMRRSPQRLALRSSRQQSLEVVFPAQALDGFSCQEDEVRASYKHRHLKAAFANVAQKDPWSAKVCISSRGVLKVTHMLTLATGAVVAPPFEAQPLLGTFTSQGAGAPQSTCVVQFVILPHDAEEGDGGMLGPDEEDMAI